MITAEGNNDVIIMLGCNFGDCSFNLDKATEALREYIDIEASSPTISTPDITGKSFDYLNRILYGKSKLTLDELKTSVKQLEISMGRNRSTPTEVIIDIDIVVYNNNIIKPSEYNASHFQTLFEKLGLPLLRIEKK